MTRITTRAELDEALRRVLLESIADEPTTAPEPVADGRLVTLAAGARHAEAPLALRPPDRTGSDPRGAAGSRRS